MQKQMQLCLQYLLTVTQYIVNVFLPDKGLGGKLIINRFIRLSLGEGGKEKLWQ
jgi:hypothetical protein